MYKSSDDVFADIDKVWDNCILYNGETSNYTHMALELRGVTDKAKKEMEEKKMSGDSEEMKGLKKQMKMMQKQLQMQMELMKKSQTLQQQQLPPPPSSAPRRHSSGKKSLGSLSEAGLVPAAERPEMTFEEKKQLSASINRLSSSNLSKIVQIVKENMPALGHGSDEIEARHPLCRPPLYPPPLRPSPTAPPSRPLCALDLSLSPPACNLSASKLPRAHLASLPAAPS